MTTDAELTRIVRTWLDEGRTQLPDRVLDAVLAELPTTPQRRSWWPARRITDMTPLTKFAVAAAAVTVVAIVGVNVLQGPAPVGPAGTPPAAASPSPAASPSLTPSAAAAPVGEMEPGRYRFTWPGHDVSFTVQDGWTGNVGGIQKSLPTGGEFGLGASLPGTPSELTHVYADACDSAGQLLPIGPTTDDLIAALENQGGVDVVTTDMGRIDQARAWRIEIRQPPGTDRSGCRHGAAGPLQIWADAAEKNYFALGTGYSGVVYVVDLDTQRLVFAGALSPETTEQSVQELDDIVRSFDFGPATSGTLPALPLLGARASPAGESAA